jgi:DNA-binding Xre family transcriptional regulator
MIKVSIREIAIKKGIKTAYQLQKLMNLQPSQAAKLYRNDLKMIGLDTLDNLCEAFDCEPSDILKYSSDRAKARNTVTELPNTKESITNNDDSSDLLNTKQVTAELGLSRRRVNDFIVSGKLKAVKGKQNHNFVSHAELERFKTTRNKMPD